MSEQENSRTAEQIGVLGNCLIEGDAEQKTRERKTKRRALTISIFLQSAAIVAIVMVPLLGHTERISYRSAIPMPPYRPLPNRPAGDSHPRGPQPPRICITCIRDVAPIPVTHDDTSLTPTPVIGNTFPMGEAPPDGFIPMIGAPSGPKPPDDPNKNRKTRVVLGGDVQGAKLIHRVDPVYPALAKALHRAGQVHLRAVISTEGNVESLQVIDGDSLLLQSSLDAVRQWHYQPTKLNGQPVEVETIITVIYSLNQ